MNDGPCLETPIDVIALYCPPESVALAQLRADAQALADVRTLDDWEYGWEMLDGECYLNTPRDAHNTRLFGGPTPDAARAAAAAWVREQKR